MQGRQGDVRLGPIAIQLMPVCKWRFSALPVLTYLKYAPLRFLQTTIFDWA